MDINQEYRDGDYDLDPFFDKTTSWPDGLQEANRFLPHLPRPIRRTCSCDNIQRYYDHFTHVQKHRGKLFTWKHYLHVLKDDLRHFDTVVLMSKAILKRMATPISSEISMYTTASESDSPKNETTEHNKPQQTIFCKKTVLGDAESITTVDTVSINSNSSFTPHKNLLQKMCKKIHALATKTCKTVEKMSKKSKYCSACGDSMGPIEIHTKCSQPFVNEVESKKPAEPDIFKATDMAKMKSESFISIPEMPTVSWKFHADSSTNKAVSEERRCNVKIYSKKTTKNKAARI